MKFTIFSAITAGVMSSILIAAIHLLRKRRSFLRAFGVRTVLFLYGICAFRMCFAMETPFTLPINIGSAASAVYAEVQAAQITLGGSVVSISTVLGASWLAGTFCVLGVFLVDLRAVSRMGKSIVKSGTPLQMEVLQTVQNEAPRIIKTDICVCPNLDIPIGAGLIRHKIFLPPIEYSPDELYYILKHEYTHFVNRDALVNVLIRLFCCVFWWNPLVYLLQNDVKQILEIKCDMAVTRKFSDEKKYRYLEVIAQSVQYLNGKKQNPRLFGTQLFRDKASIEIVERFHIISQPVHTSTIALQIMSILFSICILLGSYTVVFQPAYEPPLEDIYTHESVQESVSPNKYILKHKDGTYSAITEDGYEYPIKESTVKVFVEVEKLEIREE